MYFLEVFMCVLSSLGLQSHKEASIYCKRTDWSPLSIISASRAINLQLKRFVAFFTITTDSPSDIDFYTVNDSERTPATLGPSIVMHLHS